MIQLLYFLSSKTPHLGNVRLWLQFGKLGNNCIRKISSKGEVTTIAGSRTLGYKDGVGTAARFKSPTGVALDSVSNIYVADRGNHYVRKLVLLP